MTEYQNEWYRRNKERILADRRNKYEENSEDLRLKSREYYYRLHAENLEKKKKVRVRDKDKLKEANKLRWTSMSTEQKILRRAKERARVNGLPFDLELSDIKIPEYCPIFNIPLYSGTVAGPNTPSIDRILNQLGYVKGNVRIISMKANSMKGAMTIDDCEMLLRYMKGEL